MKESLLQKAASDLPVVLKVIKRTGIKLPCHSGGKIGGAHTER